MPDISKTSAASDRITQPQTRQSQNVTSAKAERQDTNVSIKQQLNIQILQMSFTTSIQAGNESQSLLFKAAIDKINEALAPELGADAIQSKANEDSSPEATAGRILSLSTGFFDAYAAQHPNDPPEKVAQDFVDLIRGGFEQGFKEAADILGGLNVFDGEIKDGIMKTYDLVNKGFDDFLTGKLQPADNTDNAEAPSPSSPSAPTKSS